MELEITPEPTPAEREAIVCALSAIAAVDGHSAASEWWRQGLLEGVLGRDEGHLAVSPDTVIQIAR